MVNVEGAHSSTRDDTTQYKDCQKTQQITHTHTHTGFPRRNGSSSWLHGKRTRQQLYKRSLYIFNFPRFDTGIEKFDCLILDIEA